MKKWLTLFVSSTAISLCVPFLVHAQALEVTVEPVTEEGQVVNLGMPNSVKINGKEGTWFPLETAKKVLSDVRELELRKMESELCTRETLQREDLERSLRSALDTSKEINGSYRIYVSEAEERARKAEDRLNHWTRSPILWTAIGVVLTGGLVALSVTALNSVK
jgi:hypothetical protein